MRPRGCGCRAHALKEARKCRTIEPATPRWGAGKSCVVSSRKARRSPRPRPGRTSRSRRSGSGCAAGAQATPEERASLACLAERSSRPHRSPARVPAEEEQRICELRRRTGWSPRRIADEVGRPHSTVHQVLRRGGCSRRPAPERPAVVRYEWPCPGNLLHMDVKKFGKFTEPGHAVTGDRTQRSRRVGWEYVHSIVDDCSRLAYSEIHDDETAATVTAFTRRALDWFLEHGIVAERLMTDNAFAYIQEQDARKVLLHAARSTTSDPALHAAHQRQGRALPADAATRVGLRDGVRLKRGPSGLAATLGAPLQRAAHPQRPRQPPSHQPRSGGHRAQQLARDQPELLEVGLRRLLGRVLVEVDARVELLHDVGGEVLVDRVDDLWAGPGRPSRRPTVFIRNVEL